MNEATVSCDTTIFSNKAKLYWQYNCDRIWLTLETANGQKNVIDDISVEFYGYTYRLGFHLIKEFDKTILFRSGCLANGPCVYTLIDKNNGNKIKEFGQLICIDTDIKGENPHKYNFDFVVYLSGTTDHLIIYYIDSNKTLKIPFKENLTSVIPQQQFDEMTLNNNILTLTYELEDKKKVLRINLNDKKYNR
ncbi:MAG: hypothetical protein QM642_11335 [Edaphocola sp.]